MKRFTLIAATVVAAILAVTNPASARLGMALGQQFQSAQMFGQEAPLQQFQQVAAAAAADLDVTIGGETRRFSSDALLKRPDATTIDIPADVAYGKPMRFRAIVSNYASCVFQQGPTTLRLQLLPREIDTPILMLMAAEDNELRPEDCFPQLEEMKAAGQPVAWHVYPDTYHAWDQPGIQYSHTNGFGRTSIYRYSASATADSTRRMLEFFKQNQ